MAIVARTNVVHTSGKRWGSVQPAASVSQAAGADRVRRRLSTIFHWSIGGMRASMRPGPGAPPDDPGQQLPVAARPAMLPGRSDLVVRRELLEELDVGDQARPREDPLEQVVAQERILGDAALQRRLKCLDVVDALAGVRALAEQVLVDIGGRRRIGIDARRSGGEPLEERRVAIGGHRGRDTRLQDRVALDDPALARIEDGPVERMGHRPDEADGGASRQARVRVEGDHVADRQPARPAGTAMNVVSSRPGATG